MKVGLVCPYNVLKGGGVQSCVFALQRDLTKRGHEVLILTPQVRTNGEEIPEFVRMVGTASDFNGPLHTTSQLSITLDTRQLEEILKQEKFDILHFHEPWVPLLARQILSISNVKNVATFHAKLPDTVAAKAIERVVRPYAKSILKKLDCLTAVSDAAAEFVKGLSDRSIEIIPNGVDVAYFSSIQRKPTRSILYVGRLEKRKGVKYLLMAFAELCKYIDHLELIIAGDGPAREKLEELAKELELTNVKFLGYVTDHERKKLMSTAGVFCSPALYGESFGIVLLEAMAAGIPIVAGDNPGYASVMKGRGMVSLVNPQDTANFARRLELMLFDEELKRLFTTWAKEYVKQFDYEYVVDQYEKLYKNVLSS